MGEVTNAYALIKNNTSTEVSDLCATLTASDEERQHPDKTACVDLLPGHHQVTLKLTVDTGVDQDTSIHVVVMIGEEILAEQTALSCREIAVPGWTPSNVGEIVPIP
jgi:hypothetical protein